MIQKNWTILLVAALTIMMSTITFAGGHGHQRPVKKGILLVAFGSSIPEAQVSFKNIDAKVKAAFPDVPVRWAYTSAIIRHKLAREEGKSLDSVAIALAKMMDEEFTHVAVQSLHTIAGEEYHDLVRTAEAFRDMADGFDRIMVGFPLLGTQKDLERIVDVTIRHIPEERKNGDAVILMGHGTPHPGNVFYAAMMFNFQQKDPNIFVGTVEGWPEIDDVKNLLKEKNLKKAYLMPFMSVAGDHARNDMAGDEDDSWKSILTKAGVQCVPVLKGMAEYDDVVAVWVDHLKQVMAHF